MNLSTARILITGASGGIGSAIVDALRKEGADLLLHGFRGDEMNQNLVRADMRDRNAIMDLANAAIKFDVNVLINANGINQFSEFEVAEIDHLMQVNTTGPMHLTQLLLGHLKSKPEAAILNVGSTFGQIGYPGYVAYCASKHAIKGFSEALRRELIDTSINVQHVSPRATNTSMNSESINELNAALGTHSDNPGYLAEKITRMLKNGRGRLQMGTPEKAQVLLNAFLPTLVDQAIAKQLPTIRKYLKTTGES